MATSRSPAERRDGLAANRDDAAEHRDTTAGDRDDAAGHRDATAAERDKATRRELATLDDQLLTIHQHINNHRTPVENAADAASASNLTRAEILHRQGLVAEQRRPAVHDHTAVTRLIDDLRVAVRHLQSDVDEAAADRRAAGQDRHHSARDRRGSVRDRASTAQDRDQTAIELAQDGSPQLTQVQNLPPRPEHPVSRTPHALSQSRQRLTASREQLNRTRSTDPGHVRGAVNEFDSGDTVEVKACSTKEITSQTQAELAG